MASIPPTRNCRGRTLESSTIIRCQALGTAASTIPSNTSTRQQATQISCGMALARARNQRLLPLPKYWKNSDLGSSTSTESEPEKAAR